MAQDMYEDYIDFSFFNNGGLRSPIPQGDITKEIYISLCLSKMN